MKKWISYLTCAALFTPVAATAGTQAFTGFSGGIDAGVTNSEAKINLLSGYAITGNALVGENHTSALGTPTKLFDQSGTIGLHVGYSRCFNPCILWGVELRANIQDLHNQFSDNASSQTLGATPTNFSLDRNLSVKLDQQYAAIAKLSYLFKCDSQFYVFLGPQWGHFKSKVNLEINRSDIDGGDVLVSVGSLYGTKSDTRAGWFWGIGLEQLINRCYSIGLEYNHADYGHVNVDGLLNSEIIHTVNVGPTATPGYITSLQNVHMSTNTMIVRFNYYYG